MKLGSALARFVRKPLVKIFLVLLVLIGLCALVFVRLPRQPESLYRAWMNNRLEKQARQLVSSGNYREASFSVQQLLRARPNDFEAWQMAVEIAEKDPQQSRYLPAYLGQLVRLDPSNQTNKLKFAAAALRANDFARAEGALNDLNDEGRKTPEYSALALTVALAKGDLATAETHLLRLQELRPDDELVRLNLAILRLRDSKSPQNSSARVQLSDMAQGGDYKLLALRALLTFHYLNKNAGEVLQVVEDLQKLPDLSFRDKVLILAALTQYRAGEGSAYLKQLQDDSRENAPQVIFLGEFLNKNRRYAETIDWVESLPESIQAERLVQQKVAEAYFALQKWDVLKTKLTAWDWRDFNHARHALLAFIEREQKSKSGFSTQWEQAVIAAEANVGFQRQLFEQAARWGWETEAVDLLNRIFNRDPRDPATAQRLAVYYRTKRNTANLVRLFERQLEINTEDDNVKNNYAFLSLLQRTNLTRAHVLAREVHDKDPKNPFYTTTYALSLQRQRRLEEALKLMDGLDKAVLQQPDRALYYANMLASADRIPEAEQAVAQVVEAQLLPEETEILKQTRQLIASAKRRS